MTGDRNVSDIVLEQEFSFCYQAVYLEFVICNILLTVVIAGRKVTVAVCFCALTIYCFSMTHCLQ